MGMVSPLHFAARIGALSPPPQASPALHGFAGVPALRGFDGGKSDLLVLSADDFPLAPFDNPDWQRGNAAIPILIVDPPAKGAGGQSRQPDTDPPLSERAPLVYFSQNGLLVFSQNREPLGGPANPGRALAQLLDRDGVPLKLVPPPGEALYPSPFVRFTPPTAAASHPDASPSPLPALMASLAAATMAPLLVAQLLPPSLQPGPVRLPAGGDAAPRPERAPLLTPEPAPAAPQPTPPTTPGDATPEPVPSLPPPRVEGLGRYSPALLQEILAPCLRADAGGATRRLERCAALLSSRLLADGYINSRVFPLPESAPAGTLLVVEGRIVEVRVESPDDALRRRLQRLVLPLQGQVLHLPSLERNLDQLERLPGVGGVRANLNRLGGNSTRAVLVLQVDPVATPRQGELSLRNDGSGGSGQFRAVGVLAQSGLASSGDQLLLVGELDSDDQPELGYRLFSLSYRLPLSSRLAFTTAGAASWRQLVEGPEPLDDLLFRQEQLLGRFDLNLHEGLRQRLSAFAGLSANRNRASLDGERFAAIPGGAGDGALSTGFLQAGLSWEGWLGVIGLTTTLYGLQGIASFSGNDALRELAFYGIEVGRARALGGELSLAWPLAPRWLLQLRAAGQGALTPLPNPMGFSLGSDNGLRGLPSQVISGDSGLLGSGELSWTFWRQGAQELQLVPFLGAGWVHTTRPYELETASVGAGGLLLRWLRGRHWQLELGWASQFGDGLARAVPNWLIDNGVYTKLSYRF
jgi:hemolysin activation/secretion protein